MSVHKQSCDTGFPGLVDFAYEAAVVPELWPQLLDRISSQVESIGGTLFAANPYGTRWIASGEAVQVLDDFIREGWMEKNTRMYRLAQSGYSGFANDLDLFTPDEMAQDPSYTQFLWPRGLGWGAATLIPVPNGDALVFHLERRRDRGPVERHLLDALDGLRPHLARAAMLSARMQFERARVAVETLNAIGLPAAVLGARMHMLAANGLLEALDAQVAIRAGDRLALTSPPANTLLRETLDRLEVLDEAVAASIPLPAQAGHPSAVLHLLPVRRAALDIFSNARALLVVTQLAAASAPGADLLAGLFDLTPAEARIARALTEGLTLQDAATRYGLSLETVRSQLKSVLSKTGTHRQTELVALLLGSVLPL